MQFVSIKVYLKIFVRETFDSEIRCGSHSSSTKGFVALVEGDEGGGGKAKKPKKEDAKTEEVGGFVGGAGQRGQHDGAAGGGGPGRAGGGHSVIRVHGNTEPYSLCFLSF